MISNPEHAKNHHSGDFKGLYMLYAQLLNCIQLFATAWTLARQAPLSMGFPRLEYGGGFPFPPPEDLPIPGMEPESPASPALTSVFFTTEPPKKPHTC